MLGTYFYHEILRRTVISFGTLFNEIHVQKQDKDGKVISDLNVPLAYGPRAKFLARLEQLQELNKPTAISLPRMSFEMTDLSYDATRKTSVTKTYKALDGADKVKKVYLPVPYNVGFELITLISSFTVNAPATVTLFGKPTVTVTSVPDLLTAVSISFVVPTICKSSVKRATSSVPLSASTVRDVAKLAVPAAVS